MAVSEQNKAGCDLCGGQEVEIISRQDRQGQTLITGMCLKCGLVAHHPMPDEAGIADYYRQQYRQDYHGEATPSARRVMRAWNNGQRIADQLISSLPASARLFEVGAGIGCTVKSFAERGLTAQGIEPNENFNQYTTQILQADVKNCNLFDFPAKGDQDVVLLVHVIEHFTSPVRALTTMRDLLTDDGLLYIECPNLTAPFSTFARLFHFAHTFNFSPNTLSLIAARCGFELVKTFTDDENPDIQMLFRKVVVPQDIQADGEETERIRHAIHRYHAISYHLRFSYLQRRVAKLASYWREYRQADDVVRDLEERFRP